MKIAVIIPCLNEEATIAQVVKDCYHHLPEATVYVFDNGSEDASVISAKKAGARVISSLPRGKGQVLRHAFRVVDADYVVMIDGDGTYPMSEARRLIQVATDNRYEMVMGSRLELGLPKAFRPMHYTGNRLFSALVKFLFNYPVQDLLTGFRVFSGDFIKNMHLVSRGFEVETELTLRAIGQNLAFVEVAIPYIERAQGSRSKLRTFRDGWIILGMVFHLWQHFRPLRFYSLLSALFFVTALLAPTTVSSAAAFASALFLALGFSLNQRMDAQRMRFNRRSKRLSEKDQARRKAS